MSVEIEVEFVGRLFGIAVTWLSAGMVMLAAGLRGQVRTGHSTIFRVGTTVVVLGASLAVLAGLLALVTFITRVVART